MVLNPDVDPGDQLGAEGLVQLVEEDVEDGSLVVNGGAELEG